MGGVRRVRFEGWDVSGGAVLAPGLWWHQEETSAPECSPSSRCLGNTQDNTPRSQFLMMASWGSVGQLLGADVSQCAMCSFLYHQDSVSSGPIVPTPWKIKDFSNKYFESVSMLTFSVLQSWCPVAPALSPSKCVSHLFQDPLRMATPPATMATVCFPSNIHQRWQRAAVELLPQFCIKSILMLLWTSVFKIILFWVCFLSRLLLHTSLSALCMCVYMPVMCVCGGGVFLCCLQHLPVGDRL